jgi:hypothetical protein
VAEDAEGRSRQKREEGKLTEERTEGLSLEKGARQAKLDTERKRIDWSFGLREENLQENAKPIRILRSKQHGGWELGERGSDLEEPSDLGEPRQAAKQIELQGL